MSRAYQWIGVCAALVFASWTVGCSDEQPIGPEGGPVASFSSHSPDSYTGGGSITGAIWTSDQDRTKVNENVGYDNKEEVYLNGGPLANNPNGPGSLSPSPAWYEYKVTDPSGVDLLSRDPWWCRLVRVDNGRFVAVPQGPDAIRAALAEALDDEDYLTGGAYGDLYGGTFDVVNGGGPPHWEYDPDGDCTHATGPSGGGTFPGGGISVQLYPYDDTPNNGNVYKVWITPVADFTCADQDADVYDNVVINTDPDGWPNYEDCGPQWHGNVGAYVKTDNYKVKENGAEVDGLLIVKKFHDKNFDCVIDTGEEYVTGWGIDITDPLSTTSSYQTEVGLPVVPIDPPDTYSVEEDEPSGTAHTCTLLDDVDQSGANPVDVDFEWDFNGGNYYEEHTVEFGNVGLGSIEACKVFDADGDGEADEGEGGIPGWKLTLTGTLADGSDFGSDVQYTESDGCYTWTDLYPGDYRVTETMPPSPPDYTATSDLYFDKTIQSSLTYDNGTPTIAGTDAEVEFTNVCTAEADFGTKGYWHNKNGLDEIEHAFLTGTVDLLAPYQSVCDNDDFFGAGDKLLSDGSFCDGTDVAAAFGDGIFQGVNVAGAGTWRAEVSHFLVDPVGDGGGQCEQLAEQLLAFIFNVEYRLGGGGLIETSPGVFEHTDDMIQDAIDIWTWDDENDCADEQEFIESFNSNDAVPYVPDNFCPFSYPD
jgi:hypothetical protein